MPRSALVTSGRQLVLSAQNSEALRSPSWKLKGPSVIFNIHQWERQTASVKCQRSIHSIPTVPSFVSGRLYLFTIRSFISATKSITQRGNQCWEHGCTHGTHAGSLGFHHSIGKLRQHHRSTTTKLQVGVLR